MFIDLRVPPITPWSVRLPQALRLFLKKHPLDLRSMYLLDVIIFIDFRMSGLYFGCLDLLPSKPLNIESTKVSPGNPVK